MVAVCRREQRFEAQVMGASLRPPKALGAADGGGHAAEWLPDPS